MNELIKIAHEICTSAHAGQVDKAGMPYHLHPERVAARCSTDEEIIVALLHDTIEDTDVTAQYLVQPFMATDDPRVLGIEPIPNIAEKISAMIEKYRKETIDIEDVEFEEVYLEFDTLFPDPNTSDDGREESLL